MDFGDIGENLPIIVMVIALILLQFFLRRRRKPEGTQREIVQSLLSEVRMNLSLIEAFRFRSQVKKFEAASWQRNKTKLDFLDQPLQGALSDAFMIVEDFNQQVEAAKKYKSASYMVNIDADKLTKPLTKSKEGLEEWLLAETGTKEPPPQYPGMFDSLFGSRR